MRYQDCSRLSLENVRLRSSDNDLPQDLKEENVRSFLEDNSTWILVSDETGGEGRNFQGASEIIHYDNPWHIAKIEQRIGRLDRLGREVFDTTVLSNVLVPRGSVEQGFVECLSSGLGVYQSSISGLEFALREVEQILVRTALRKGFGWVNRTS